MRVLPAALLMVAAIPAVADQYYPVMDADGKVHLMARPDASPAGAASKPTAPGQSSDAGPGASTAQGSPGSQDDLTYQSSEELEKSGYRPKGKQRFYYFSDRSMGLAPIVSDKGVPVMTPAVEPPAADDIAKPSPQYQALSRADTLGLLGLKDECLSRKLLRRAISLKDALSLTVSDPLQPSDVANPDLVVDTRKGGEAVAFRLRSFASKKRSPNFYVPAPVFLDRNGCVLGGAWNYWTEHKPASQMSYEMIDGLLLAPRGTALIAFYRPASRMRLPAAFGYPGSLTLESFQ